MDETTIGRVILPRFERRYRLDRKENGSKESIGIDISNIARRAKRRFSNRSRRRRRMLVHNTPLDVGFEYLSKETIEIKYYINNNLQRLIL